MISAADVGSGKRGLLSERVARQIERHIAERGLKPGDRLPSGRELTELYGVSRTVVRDAIAILEQRGQVETWPGSGVFVCDGGSDAVAGVLGQMLRRNAISLAELLETRHLLEIRNAEAAASRATTENLSAMREAIAAMRHATAPLAFVDADVVFHEAVAAAGANRVLAAFLGSLRPMLLRGMLIGTNVGGAREAAIAEHERLLGAIAKGDSAAAGDLMATHLRRSYAEWAASGDGDVAAALTSDPRFEP